jgi:acyl carrier protein
MEAQKKQKIFDVIKKEINADPATIDPTKPIRDQVSLDSMQFVGLVARLEIELDIELPMTIMEVKTLNEFFDIVDGELENRN